MKAVDGWPMPVIQQKHASSKTSDTWIAGWTALGPICASANSQCSRKKCAKIDHLISQSCNAAAHAAHTGNALAIPVAIAAVWKTISTDDQDSKNLVDLALAAHCQLTHDVGEAMSLAILCCRQIWLSKTALPDAI